MENVSGGKVELDTRVFNGAKLADNDGSMLDSDNVLGEHNDSGEGDRISGKSGNVEVVDCVIEALDGLE